MLQGPSNVGKTFLNIGMLLSIAAGIPMLGRAVRQGPTLCYPLEGTGALVDRCAAWLIANGLDELPSGFVSRRPINLAQASCVEMVLQDVDRVMRASKNFVKLISIDTFSRAIAGADENSAKEMSTIVAHLDEIRRQTGATVLLVHHTGKDETRGARGSSSLPAAVDTILSMTSKDDRIELRVEKQRDLPKVDTVHLALRQVEVGRDEEGEVVRSCVIDQIDAEGGPEAASPDLLVDEQLLLDLLMRLSAEREPDRWVSREDWRISALEIFTEDRQKTPGAARKAWSRGAKELLELGLFEQDGDLVRPTSETEAASGPAWGAGLPQHHQLPDQGLLAKEQHDHGPGEEQRDEVPVREELGPADLAAEDEAGEEPLTD
jgi:hypothetical protein